MCTESADRKEQAEKKDKDKPRHGKGNERLEKSKICLHSVDAVMLYRHQVAGRQFRATSRKSD